MKPTFENLEKLEAEIRFSFNNTKNSYNWLNTLKGSMLQKRWEKMMLELRGFADLTHKEDHNYKKGWVQYCEHKNLDPNYNFGDVLA